MTNTANREIRVFISSTFRDMHVERDYLVSKRLALPPILNFHSVI